MYSSGRQIHYRKLQSDTRSPVYFFPYLIATMQRMVENCFKQVVAFVLCNGELRLQSVAYSHQFVDLGNDADLLCERWDGYWKAFKLCRFDSLYR